MKIRVASLSDEEKVLTLYKQYLESEPCSVHLQLNNKEIDKKPSIIQSLRMLIQSGNVLLSVAGYGEENVLGKSEALSRSIYMYLIGLKAKFKST